MEESKICNFYHDKHILMTGATGFMGRITLEKLLRVCKPKMIYLLIRAKNSNEPQKRLQELTENKMFDRMKKEVPQFMDHITIVSGDISLPGLDLLPCDRDVLIEKVQVVLHGAATVKFDERLSLATKINVLGTKSILELCHEMKNLLSVVYVSTAYSNCLHKTIKEEFYETPISSHNLIKLTEYLKEEQLEMITTFIKKKKWPNTYVFTKAVAEEAIKTHGKGLPIAVFRPAIVMAAKNEPYPGWSDNLYGPQGISLGCAVGLIHVTTTDVNCKADIVPADLAVNCLLAVAYNTSTVESRLQIPIYNFCSSTTNTINWGKYMSICTKRIREVPLSHGVWYYSTTMLVKSWITFSILAFFMHTLPAFLIDTGLFLTMRKPKALKIYKKIHKIQKLLHFFSVHYWDFSIDNTDNLWKNLPAKDKILFEFDMASLDYNSYLRSYIDGLRRYMLKDDDSTITYAKRKNTQLYIVHRLVQLLFFSSFGWCIWKLSSSVIIR